MVFHKRKYTFSSFVKTIAEFLQNFNSLLNTLSSKRLSPELIEKINIIVTAVNGCRYCSWVHLRILMKLGISVEEMNNLMGLDLAKIDHEEQEALLFAQSYAENDGIPSVDDLLRLIKIYGTEKATDILNHIKIIRLANLAGNTFDSFGYRLKQDLKIQGSFLFELLFYWIAFPFYKITTLLKNGKIR